MPNNPALLVKGNLSIVCLSLCPQDILEGEPVHVDGTTVQVSFEEVADIVGLRQRINDLPFAAIEWTQQGKPLELSAEVAHTFERNGLCNINFPFMVEQMEALAASRVLADEPRSAPYTGEKVRVSFEFVLNIMQRRARINRLPFEDIEWRCAGERAVIDPKVAERFTFCGLNNTEFPEMIEVLAKERD